ncbi:MAG: cobalt-precorrin-5B (C(1))-methyltransferase CbiD [bacterium]|nr:cobalt-precorrin-5B (C(1))-methyltransferase CbiD [bacterium]
MAFEHYVYSGTEKLRRGFTTGTCAALAAKAAALALLTGEEQASVSLMTPAGLEVDVELSRMELGESRATCGVLKDAGDDYDVTNGTEVISTVALIERGVEIDGGHGVGRVTKPGLDQPVGNAAINSGPRKMIAGEVMAVAEDLGYTGGFSVLVEIPDGAELAAKTFNPHIGIEGGISVLGTSGIVEPRSLKALMDSLEVEIHACAASGSKRLIVTPGNYGENFLATMGLPEGIPTVKCANFIGNTLDCIAREGFEEVLLVGHIGKMVKVAGGIMDTHSKVADCRCEIFAAHAAYCGASQEAIARIFDAATSDACLDILEECGLKEPVIERVIDAIQSRLEHRVDGAYGIGCVVFTNRTGSLGMSDEAKVLVENWRERA